MFRVLFLLILLLCPSSAWAIKYWADPAGSNVAVCTDIDGDADPLSYGTPQRALVCAVANSGSGHIVQLKSGTYTGANALFTDLSVTWNATGTSFDAPAVTLQGSGMDVSILANNGSGTGCVRLRGKPYVIIKDLTCDGVNNTSTVNGIFLSKDSGTGISSHHVRIQNVKVKNWLDNGVFTNEHAHFLHITNSKFHNNGSVSSTLSHGCYVSGDDVTIERSEFYQNAAGGCQIFIGAASSESDGRADRPTFRYNKVYDNVTFGLVIDGQDAVVHDNLVYGTTKGDGIQSGYTGSERGKFYNNLAYNNAGYGVRLGAFGDADNSEIVNNIILANASGQIQIESGTTGVTQTTNKTAGTVTDCTVSTTDFTHKVGSTCIDAGSSVSTRSCNGTCDQGPFESLNSPAPTCTVENGDANTVRGSFTNSNYAPIQVTNVTGITIQVNSGDRVESAPTVVGSNLIYFTIDGAAVTAGQTVTFAASSSNTIRDSALIGNVTNQALHATATITCTNNVGGGGTHVFTVTYFAFNQLRGAEAAPIRLPHSGAAVSTNNIRVVTGGALRLRVKIACTVADCPTIGVLLRYSRNGGAYTVVPDSFGADNIRFFGTVSDPDIPAQGTQTTEQLTSDHAANVTGSIVRTSSAIPTFDLAQNSEIELEYVVEIDSDTAAKDQFCFRPYNQDGSALTYGATPCFTVIDLTAGS